MTDFPIFDKKTDDQDKDKEFHIGLVMAGAISAGAYTAGVMDFLIEAITAWDKAKRPENVTPDIPTHSVQFDVLAGASAGGMCAGIFASALRNYQPGVTAPAPDCRSENTFYQAWVINVGYQAMVRTDDLKKGKAPASILNVEGTLGLDDIRDKALDVEAPADAPWPAWLRDPLPIILSINNLRGVPYMLNFAGTTAGRTHGMSLHKDYITFSLSDQNRVPPHAINLNFRAKGQTGGWEEFGKATLATGAFPAAFKPRRLKRDAELYDARKYSIPQVDGRLRWQTIDPSWPGANHPDPYEHWTVDGGTMNNEPMELARKALADKTGRNNRDPKEASRMLFMVDPFPNALKDEDGASEGTLVGSLTKLIGSWTSQSRMKIEDLLLFGDNSTSSRFAVAPTCKEDRAFPLACASLGAFGGVLDVNWRHHDYLLGRLNCQKFLMDWFLIDKGNRIVENANPQLVGDKARIIPLVNGMEKPEAAVQGIEEDNFVIPWPTHWNRRQTRSFTKLLHKRLKKVLSAQIKAKPPKTKGHQSKNRNFLGKIRSGFGKILSGIGSWFVLLYLNIGLWAAKSKICKAIEENLESHDLFKEE